jgi:D-beta-D-heptose 7-phosphate kinase / D-beta-D-heptose 1-phosphate adenosyltransferase
MWKSKLSNRAAAAFAASELDMSPLEILEKMQDAHIAVVGDAMVDRYEFGRVERICPEAPVPIFIPERSENRPGGAANVLRQLMQLGCTAYQAFAPDWCIKTRYVAGTQLVLRVDNDRFANPTQQDVDGVGKYIASIKQLNAVILSDYAKGWLSYEMCTRVIGASSHRFVPVIVDPKGNDLLKFTGCSLICPSTSDEFTDEEYSLFHDVLLKRGAEGLRLSCSASDYGRIPASITDIPATARHVYDVTGAGDTVVAVAAAALAVGASKLEAATLAALAAGYVVGEVGTTVCSKEKLKELIDANSHS